jgi:hypothetical protein
MIRFYSINIRKIRYDMSLFYTIMVRSNALQNPPTPIVIISGYGCHNHIVFMPFMFIIQM